MRCDQARRAVSRRLDEPLEPPLDAELADHTRTCPACHAYTAALVAVRQRLRLEPVDEVPDVSGRVRHELERRRRPGSAVRLARALQGAGRAVPAGGVRGTSAGGWLSVRPWLPAATAFVAAFIAGAVVVGVATPPRSFAEGLGERVLAAQSQLQEVSGELRVTERGWHPAVPERTYAGRFAYRAPEQLLLQLRDTTSYPGARWPRNDITVVVDADRAWSRGLAPCPTALQPTCMPRQPRTQALVRREPFSEATPVPLELVLPVRSFSPGVQPRLLGSRRVGGRTAVGLATTVAQVAPLLEGLTATGNWRGLHPGDHAEVWLEQPSLVPLELRVLAADSLERRRWAASHGYDDPLGRPVLELSLDGLRLQDAGVRPPGAPASAPVRDGGFDDLELDPAAAPVPGWLPPDMRPHRVGIARGGSHDVAVRTWSDGRAWLKVRVVHGWAGDRLFGDLGSLVRRVPLTGSAVGYTNELGDRVAVHTNRVDVVVTGSLAEAALRRVAASLGLHGRPVPASWAEATTSSLSDAAQELPGLLVPAQLAGFGPPGVQVHGQTVALGYAGGGSRSLLVVQTPGDVLAPPLDSAVVGVTLRGTTGRYTASLGELEWVEDGRVVALRSRTLGLAELMQVAASLEPHR